MPDKPKITPGQGLLLLLQHYQDDPQKLHQLKILYLCGAHTGDRCIDICTFLIEEPVLNSYELVIDEHSINTDATRRYFETHLAYETLKHQLPDMHLFPLRKHYQRSSALVNKTMSDHKRQTITEVFKGECSEPSFYMGLNNEFNTYIKRLKEGSIFQELGEEAREKIKWLVRINYISMVNGWRRTPLPLDIYKTHPWYIAKGTISHTTEQLSTRSQHFGLMKSYMLLPKEDKALSTIPFTHVKSCDYHQFDPDSAAVQACFQQLVHIFSTSISGQLLMQLKILAKFHQDNRSNLFTDSTEKFVQYIRLMMSTSMYYSGGHSLYEYMVVLQIEEVQQAFQSIPGFSNLDLAILFYYGNETAFDIALERAIQYNTQLLTRQKMHSQLLTCSQRLFKTPSPVGVDDPRLDESIQLNKRPGCRY